MNIVFLCGEDNPYDRAIYTNLKFEGVNFKTISVSRSINEKIKLVKNIIKRTGWEGLFYYLNERKIENKYFFKIIHYLPLSMQKNISYASGINSRATKNLLKSMNPDLVILGQVGILDDEILSIAKIGVLNGHTALLPYYRGYTDPAHMIKDGCKVHMGVTVHWTIRKLDAGSIISTKLFNMMHKPKCLSHLLGHLRHEAALLLVKEVGKINKGIIPKTIEQNEMLGKVCYLMPHKERITMDHIYSSFPDNFFDKNI